MQFLSQIRLALFFTWKGLLRGSKLVVVAIIILLAIVFLNIGIIRSLFSGISSTLESQYIDTLQSHITIVNKNGDKISNTDQVLDKIQQYPEVKGATPLSSFGAQLSFAENRSTTAVNSMNLDTFSKVFIHQDRIIEGRGLQAGDQGKILLGVQTAGVDDERLTYYESSLKTVHTGDIIQVRLSPNQVENMEVVGIYSANFNMGDLGVYILDTEFQKITKTNSNQSEKIFIRLNNIEDLDKVVEQISQDFPEFKISRWNPKVGVIGSLNSIFTILDTAFAVITMIITLVIVLIVTYIDLISKRKSIGIERALGISELTIELSYIFRAIFLAVIGITIGLLLLYYILTPLSIAYPTVYPFGYVSLLPEFRLLRGSILFIFSASILAAYLPSRLQNKKSIISSIWG